MSRTIALADLGRRFSTLPDELLQDDDLSATVLNEDGKPVLAILPYELYSVLLEMLRPSQPAAVVAEPLA